MVDLDNLPSLSQITCIGNYDFAKECILSINVIPPIYEFY